MAQQYDTTPTEVAQSVGQTHGKQLEEAISTLLSSTGSSAKAQKIESVSEIAESNADVLFFDSNLDTSDEPLQFNDTGRDNGRAYIFEGDKGFKATFNTVERVIIGSAGSDDFTVAGDKNTTVEGGVGNDTLTASGGNDSITGGTGNDSITAGAGNDTVAAGEGSDTVVAGSGTDSVIGGKGSDTVSFSGNRSDFTITTDDGMVTVTSNSNPEDVTTLVNVEKLQFSDGTEDVQYGDDLSVIATLYNQVLGRQADLAGFQFWGDSMDAGKSYGGIAIEFINSSENNLELDLAMTPEAFANQALDVLYQELLGREADGEGKAFWSEQIVSGGTTVDQVAQSFVQSDELKDHMMSSSDWDFFM